MDVKLHTYMCPSCRHLITISLIENNEIDAMYCKTCGANMHRIFIGGDDHPLKPEWSGPYVSSNA